MIESAFAQHFENLLSRAPDTYLKSAREHFLRYQQLGWPTESLEAWKYSHLSQYARTDWKLPKVFNPEEQPQDLLKIIAECQVGSLLVFVNGVYKANLSRLEDSLNLRVGYNADLLSALDVNSAELVSSGLRQLSAALATDRPHVKILKSTKESELHLLYYFSSSKEEEIYNCQIQIEIEKEARTQVKAAVVNSSSCRSFANLDIDIQCAENANLVLQTAISEGLQSRTVLRENVVLKKYSQLRAVSAVHGSSYCRFEQNVFCSGMGAEADLSGVFFGVENSVVDVKPRVYHMFPHTSSHQKFNGLIQKDSRAIFTGKIFIAPQAQETKSAMLNKNLVLHDDSEIYTKPELDIFADNVKANHGATVGKFDEAELFYLQSRGISRVEAEAILQRAFIAQIFDEKNKEFAFLNLFSNHEVSP